MTLDDELLARTEQLCGDLERSALLKEALRSLLQRKSARRLAALGGVILVDTSVWVAHLCNRGEVLELLQGLPGAVVASDSEVLLLIEREQLMGRGGRFHQHGTPLQQRPHPGPVSCREKADLQWRAGRGQGP